MATNTQIQRDAKPVCSCCACSMPRIAMAPGELTRSTVTPPVPNRCFPSPRPVSFCCSQNHRVHRAGRYGGCPAIVLAAARGWSGWDQNVEAFSSALPGHLAAHFLCQRFDIASPSPVPPYCACGCRVRPALTHRNNGRCMWHVTVPYL